VGVGDETRSWLWSDTTISFLAVDWLVPSDVASLSSESRQLGESEMRWHGESTELL